MRARATNCIGYGPIGNIGSEMRTRSPPSSSSAKSLQAAAIGNGIAVVSLIRSSMKLERTSSTDG